MNDELIDEPRAIRAGEELDTERLAEYLRSSLPEVGNAPMEVRQFPSGHSNLTYSVRAGSKEYVLRRPPFGSKVKSAHDMGREYRILSRLHRVYPLAPEPLLFCEDPGILGANFYVMRRIQGVILRKSIPPELNLSPEGVRRLNEALIDNLATLHGLDYAAAGLEDLGKPEGYVERQVQGWTKRYLDSKTDDIEAVDSVSRWLADHLPSQSRASLIHNDYKLDNVVLDPETPTQIIGVLDWEMSTLGDPFMDLGTTLSYWVEANDPPPMQVLRSGPTIHPGSLSRIEVVERYQSVSGRTVDNPLFYYAFGLFKTAVVIQQIYYRYKKGLTKDERFASFILGVEALCRQGAAAIEAGHI